MEARRAPPGHPLGSTHTPRRRGEPGSRSSPKVVRLQEAAAMGLREGHRCAERMAPSAASASCAVAGEQLPVRMAGDLRVTRDEHHQASMPPRLRASEGPCQRGAVPENIRDVARASPGVPLRPGHGSGSGDHRGSSWRQPGAEGQRAWSVKGLATPSIASSSRPPGHLSPLPAQCIQMGVSTTANVALAGPHHTAPHRP